MVTLSDEQVKALKSVGVFFEEAAQNNMAQFRANTTSRESKAKSELQGGASMIAAPALTSERTSKAEEIVDQSFRYLFHNPDIIPDQVAALMLRSDGVVRYSMMAEPIIGRMGAIVIFGAASVVLRARMKDGELMRFADKFVFNEHSINVGLPLPEVRNSLLELVDVGVLARYIKQQHGQEPTDYYGFINEELCFPPFGELKRN